ncbi:MAG: redoxin domain-containing protein [Luteitalea sp.]|nr:redoxin domain-containing protein [Luteitalea sp.]
MPCRRHLLQLQQHEQTFNDLATRIAVVTFETTPFARAYVDDMKISWPLLIDSDRTLYHAYGMHRARLWDLWGPGTWWAYAKELARGKLPGRPHADTSQLGGDVLIDPSGIVRFHYVGVGPADRPSITAILTAHRER